MLAVATAFGDKLAVPQLEPYGWEERVLDDVKASVIGPPSRNA